MYSLFFDNNKIHIKSASKQRLSCMCCSSLKLKVYCFLLINKTKTIIFCLHYAKIHLDKKKKEKKLPDRNGHNESCLETLFVSHHCCCEQNCWNLCNTLYFYITRAHSDRNRKGKRRSWAPRFGKHLTEAGRLTLLFGNYLSLMRKLNHKHFVVKRCYN